MPSLIALPDERRVHEKPTPTAGGAAMLFPFLITMFVASRFDRFAPVFDGTEWIGVVVGATVILLVGLLDDLREMSAPAKLAGTVLGASLMAFQGVQMLYFRVPFWDTLILDQTTGFLITVVWVVVVTTAINIIDGLDGLAAGIALIAGAAFFFYSQRQADAGLLGSDSIGPLLAVVVVGVCAGFLPHNFHPAKVFMGDAGALFLGVLLATSTLVVGGRTNDEFSGQTFFFFAPVLIPFVILGVPLFDTAFAFVRRVARRTTFHIGDKNHIHHRLERLGHGHRRAVLILWAWTAVLAVLTVAPTYYSNVNVLVLPGILALGILLYTVLHPEVRATRQNAAINGNESPVVVVVEDGNGQAATPERDPSRSS